MAIRLSHAQDHSAALCAMALVTFAWGCGDGGDGNGGNGGPAPTLTATFDAGDEGWTVVTLPSQQQTADPDYGAVLGSLAATWHGSGGVDGSGYIEHADGTDDAPFFSAPASFLGDKSAYLGGRLHFQIRSSTIDTGGDAAVVLEGAGITLATLIAPPDAGWSTFEPSLDVNDRNYHETNLQGPVVDQQTLAAVLADLEALRISAEYASGPVEVVGLDEVSLRGP